MERTWIYWGDIAEELGLNLTELKSILSKRTRDLPCTDAESYFIKQLTTTLATKKNTFVTDALKDPGSARWALELSDPKYSVKFKDAVRLQAVCTLNVLERVCNDEENCEKTPQEIFEIFLREMSNEDSSGAVIEAYEMISEH